jgi:adenosylcobinamide kinase/adenosylcobinamide-phosphate guanylyltransferase
MTCESGDLPREYACTALRFESGRYRAAGQFFHPGGSPFSLDSCSGQADLGGAFTSVMLTLVIGGARSGKSRFAQSLPARGQRVTYLATCRGEDSEMAVRIARHRSDRPAHWVTLEEPLAIAEAVERTAHHCDYILLDCLTIWISNMSWEHRQSTEEELHSAVSRELARLVAAARNTHLVVVSNELGCGLVPDSPVGRLFRDVHGWANQDVAAAAEWVYYLVAGIAVPIKKPEESR